MQVGKSPFVFLLYLQLVDSYIHMSRLRVNLMNCILTSPKIKHDFKTIDKNEAFQLTSFWYNELMQMQKSDIDVWYQGLKLLYQPISRESDDYINFKYNILCNSQDEKYVIWRPKVQLSLEKTYNALSATKQENSSDNSNPLLYPSFRESIYLVSFYGYNREEGVKIKNIVKSPFWIDDDYNSTNIFNEAMTSYFVSYLKYSNIVNIDYQ